MQHFRNNYFNYEQRDGDSLIKKVRFIANNGVVTYPSELYDSNNMIDENVIVPQNYNTKIVYGLVDSPYYFETYDVISFEPDIMQLNDIVYVNCNWCDKYGNISAKPIDCEDKYVGKYLVKIVYIYSTNPIKKRKNTYGRDDDRKR
jgi:hypothetical protein